MADPDSRAGSSYANKAIVEYARRCHAEHDEALQRAYDAHERHGLPSIQVGPSEGKLLQLLLRSIGARRVVEVGTLGGYSAIWMARALRADGRLYTLEKNPAYAEVAKANLEAAQLSDRVTVMVGDAIDTLAELKGEGPFCAVFIDADKERYDQYGRWARANLRPGGLLLGDNAYYFGDLLDDSPGAEAMRRFHEEAASEMDSVCAPTPDGLLVARQKP